MQHNLNYAQNAYFDTQNMSTDPGDYLHVMQPSTYTDTQATSQTFYPPMVEINLNSNSMISEVSDANDSFSLTNLEKFDPYETENVPMLLQNMTAFQTDLQSNVAINQFQVDQSFMDMYPAPQNTYAMLTANDRSDRDSQPLEHSDLQYLQTIDPNLSCSQNSQVLMNIETDSQVIASVTLDSQQQQLHNLDHDKSSVNDETAIDVIDPKLIPKIKSTTAKLTRVKKDVKPLKNQLQKLIEPKKELKLQIQTDQNTDSNMDVDKNANKSKQKCKKDSKLAHNETKKESKTKQKKEKKNENENSDEIIEKQLEEQTDEHISEDIGDNTKKKKQRKLNDEQRKSVPANKDQRDIFAGDKSKNLEITEASNKSGYKPFNRNQIPLIIRNYLTSHQWKKSAKMILILTQDSRLYGDILLKTGLLIFDKKLHHRLEERDKIMFELGQFNRLIQNIAGVSRIEATLEQLYLCFKYHHFEFIDNIILNPIKYIKKHHSTEKKKVAGNNYKGFIEFYKYYRHFDTLMSNETIDDHFVHLSHISIIIGLKSIALKQVYPVDFYFLCLINIMIYYEKVEEAYDVLQAYVEKHPLNINALLYLRKFNQLFVHSRQLDEQCTKNLISLDPGNVNILDWINDLSDVVERVRVLFNFVDFVHNKHNHKAWKALLKFMNETWSDKQKKKTVCLAYEKYFASYWPAYQFIVEPQVEPLKYSKCLYFKAKVCLLLMNKSAAMPFVEQVQVYLQNHNVHLDEKLNNYIDSELPEERAEDAGSEHESVANCSQDAVFDGDNSDDNEDKEGEQSDDAADCVQDGDGDGPDQDDHLDSDHQRHFDEETEIEQSDDAGE